MSKLKKEEAVQEQKVSSGKDLSALDEKQLLALAPKNGSSAKTRGEFAALVELYRRQSPVKFATKEVAFAKQLASLPE